LFTIQPSLRRARSELDGDRGWSVSDKVLELSSGDIGIHELENVVLVALLGKLDGDGGRSVGDEVLELSSGDIGVHELENVVFVRLLGKLDGNGGRSIGNKVLQLASGDVSIHKLEDVVLVGLLSQLDGDRGWSIGDEVLELASGNVGIHKLENVVLIGFLGKLDSDRGWSISDEVLELTSGYVGVHELEDVVFVGLADVRIELDELLGDWGSLILDKGLEGLLGDVLTVELANDGVGSGGSWLLESGGSIRDGVVSIIIRETLIELGGNELTTVPLVEDLSTSGRRDSSYHHRDGNVIMVIRVLNFISIFSEDGGKGIITNNFSESLKSDAINDISVEMRVASNVDGVNLINRDHEGLRVLHHIGGRELHSTGSSNGSTISINVDVWDNSVKSVVRRSMLLGVLVFVMLSLLELNEILLGGDSLESLVSLEERAQV